MLRHAHFYMKVGSEEEPADQVLYLRGFTLRKLVEEAGQDWSEQAP
jgi:hypothetical protein